MAREDARDVKLLPTFLILCAPVGCALGSAEPATGTDPESSPSQYALSMPAADAASVLELVNYPGTDAATLDHAVGLDSRAAQNIAKHRAGPDGIVPSADDAYFSDLGELDAVPYVGDTAFQKLQSYAALHPAPSSESVEGVFFRGWEAETVVWAVNHLDPAALDAVLDDRAANGLVARRPLATVTAMGPVPYVGPSALEALRNSSTAWWSLMRSSSTDTLAGTFDSVSFDEQTAEIALAIANGATLSELTSHQMTTTPAEAVIAGRPYASLSAVAAQKGVGNASMQALHDYAASGTWGVPAGPNACIDAFSSAVNPYLGDVLFLSESDREIDVVSFAGAGKAAPTAEQLLALVKPPAGSTTELRSVDDFYVALEPSSANADPTAAATIQSIVSSQLSDVIFVKLHNPAGSLYQAEVGAYLVGRTACGDLVALHAIAIET